MVMSGWSVILTTLILSISYEIIHYFMPVTENCPSLIRGRRNISMWPDQVSNLGPLAHESDALRTAPYCLPKQL